LRDDARVARGSPADAREVLRQVATSHGIAGDPAGAREVGNPCEGFMLWRVGEALVRVYV
jgi:hypothetical protein